MNKEIAVSVEEAHRHFSKIASKYRSLRTTDSEPILHIKQRLNGKSGINEKLRFVYEMDYEKTMGKLH